MGEKLMICRNQELLKYIPQRPPIVMIDSLHSAKPDEFIGGLQIQESNLFVENQTFSEAGILEHIAQTAAAGTGYLCAQEKKPVQKGFIGQIKKVNFFRLPKVKENICTCIQITAQVFDVSIIKATVSIGEECIATGEMKIFLQPEN
ncbi:MAG: hydroxymyristoyl-ACP dehydratase [Bacteroidales bacterium]